jgi:hypothetical protein
MYNRMKALVYYGAGKKPGRKANPRYHFALKDIIKAYALLKMLPGKKL